jgi:hypothetical protein
MILHIHIPNQHKPNIIHYCASISTYLSFKLFFLTNFFTAPVAPPPKLCLFFALLIVAAGLPYGGGRRLRAAAQSNGTLALRLGLLNGDAAACAICTRRGVTGSIFSGCLELELTSPLVNGDEGEAGVRSWPFIGLSGEGVVGVLGVPVPTDWLLRARGEEGSTATDAFFACANRRRAITPVLHKVEW